MENQTRYLLLHLHNVLASRDRENDNFLHQALAINAILDGFLSSARTI